MWSSKTDRYSLEFSPHRYNANLLRVLPKHSPGQDPTRIVFLDGIPLPMPREAKP